MDKKSTKKHQSYCIDAAEGLVSDLLKTERSVPEISFALASVATDLSLQGASTPMHALTIVTSAISKTLAAHAAIHDNHKSNGSSSVEGDELSIFDADSFGRSVH